MRTLILAAFAAALMLTAQAQAQPVDDTGPGCGNPFLVQPSAGAPQAELPKGSGKLYAISVYSNCQNAFYYTLMLRDATENNPHWRRFGTPFASWKLARRFTMLDGSPCIQVDQQGCPAEGESLEGIIRGYAKGALNPVPFVLQAMAKFNVDIASLTGFSVTWPQDMLLESAIVANAAWMIGRLPNGLDFVAPR